MNTARRHLVALFLAELHAFVEDLLRRLHGMELWHELGWGRQQLLRLF